MSERIKELAVEADEYTEQTVHYYQGQFDGLTWESKIKQTRDTKFAELIVKECASRVDHILRERQAGGGTMGDEIREHFGVEE